VEVKQTPALLDVPQPLGFLPTRRFWGDLENVRLVDHVRVVLVVVTVIVVGALSPSWWFAGLAGAGSVVLVHGLLERYIRQAAKRRFRSPHKQTELIEDSSTPDRPPTK
jgi:hypothetical protein